MSVLVAAFTVASWTIGVAKPGAQTPPTRLSVAPIEAARPSMPVGGELNRSYVIYELAHLGTESDAPIEWSAYSFDRWIRVGSADPLVGTLSPGERVTVSVRLDAATLPSLPDFLETVTALGTVQFEDRTTGSVLTREITVDVVRPRWRVRTVPVSGAAVQPGGPDYSYEVAPLLVTNGEFAAFLNDALYHPDDPRGTYMYFDLRSGDVYLHTQESGGAGDGADGHTVRLFAEAQAPGVEFVDGSYHAHTSAVDLSEHPVTGVSWYGAVKYSNWLTLDQGFGVDERCYAEGTTNALSDWRPVVLDAIAWRSRDLSDGEALRLTRVCRGYRLPMDDGYANADPTIDSADAFNEWFKAAAWNPALGRNTIYGFGRDTLTSLDANFRCSGDPFESPTECHVGGTTPVGFFDGVTADVSGVVFPSRADGNGFGLFDMTGNVHQWMQGRYAPSNVQDQRVLRGGSWNDPATAASLKAAGRTVWAPPGTTHREIGFRVVRSTASSGDFDADGMVDRDDVPVLGICLTGPDAVPLGGCRSGDVDEDGDVDLDDLNAWQRLFGGQP